MRAAALGVPMALPLDHCSRRAPSAPPGPGPSLAAAEPPSPSATAHAPASPTLLWAREREWRAGEPLISAQGVLAPLACHLAQAPSPCAAAFFNRHGDSGCRGHCHHHHDDALPARSLLLELPHTILSAAIESVCQGSMQRPGFCPLAPSWRRSEGGPGPGWGGGDGWLPVKTLDL